jgi:selenide, water dikinase
MGPTALAQVLRPLLALFPSSSYPDLLVGLDGPDDAAVYRLDDETALVVTTDFFPPVVDDPHAFGQIAAANAMSDVFAMGGEVILALNLAVFPDRLGTDHMAAIVRGGAEKVAEAGGVLAGGHTVSGDEPMYGLAVVGRAHPDRLLRKDGVRAGDVLVLTKALGTGLVTTALKAGRAAPDHVAAATRAMVMLNRAAARGAVAAGARAATDVTGFGLVGHAAEMAVQSKVVLRIDPGAVALLPGALEYAERGHVPGGTTRNRDGFAAHVAGLVDLPQVWQDVVCDPQTSGGLLIAVAPEGLGALQSLLAASATDARVIGQAEAGDVPGLVLGALP